MKDRRDKRNDVKKIQIFTESIPNLNSFLTLHLFPRILLYLEKLLTKVVSYTLAYYKLIFLRLIYSQNYLNLMMKNVPLFVSFILLGTIFLRVTCDESRASVVLPLCISRFQLDQRHSAR